MPSKNSRKNKWWKPKPKLEEVTLISKAGEIKIIELREGAPKGTYSNPIKVHPNSNKTVSSTKFLESAKQSGRASVLGILRNEQDTEKTLCSTDFMTYEQITFKLDKDEKLIVEGVRRDSREVVNL